MRHLIRFSWAFGLAGSLCIFAALAFWYVTGSLDGTPRGLALAGALGIGGWLVLDRERVGDTVTSRAFTYGSGAALLTVMATVLGVGLFVLARDHDRTWDWTGGKAFTLSDHTMRICAGMEDDVEVLAFFRSKTVDELAFQKLARLLGEACPRVSLTQVDPVSRPTLAEANEVRAESGVVILERSDGETRRVEGRIDEERLVDALVVLLADEEHTICWSTGHDEANPDDEFSERGYGLIVFELDDLNYRIQPVQAATEGVPASCSAFVIAGSRTAWGIAELESLAAYVAQGGRLLLLLEPGGSPALAADLQRLGVLVRPDVVFDLNPKNLLMGVDEPSFVVLADDNLRPHAITGSLGAAVVLPTSRSVVLEERDGLVGRSVLVTSDQAWGETDFDGTEFTLDADEVQGEVPLMVVVEVSDPDVLGADAQEPVAGGRVVVVGDSDFASNLYAGWGNNRDLFLNSVAWLVDEEDQIGERSESGDVLELTVLSGALLVLVNLLLLPALAIAGAVLASMRRRFL